MKPDDWHFLGGAALFALTFIVLVRTTWWFEYHGPVKASLANYLGWTFFFVIYHALLITAVFGFSQ